MASSGAHYKRVTVTEFAREEIDGGVGRGFLIVAQHIRLSLRRCEHYRARVRLDRLVKYGQLLAHLT